MALFVDHAGLNTLVSSSFDGNNLSSGRNTEILSIDAADELVGINTHRNGPYGFSSWKQIRASENPITRHHKKTNTFTFVIQPGPIRNILPNGELRVKDRSSFIHSFNEPVIAQKAYPLVWNVGTHFKDEDGFVDMKNPFRYSILSSYANGKIGFANKRIDELLNYSREDNEQEYKAIKNTYLDGGLNKLDSDITHWEFLQYRETVFPHMKNQFQVENLGRPNFLSFYRHKRKDRTKILSVNNFGYSGGTKNHVSQSSWPLDEHESFLTRTFLSASEAIDFGKANNSEARAGQGVLLSNTQPFINGLQSINANIASGNKTLVADALAKVDRGLGPSALYSRRISLKNTASVSNPTGMEIPQTGSLSINKVFEGGAFWEAGATRQIKDSDGNYVSSPKNPFYDTYSDYISDARRRYKNFSVVPEFRISTQIEDYIRNNNAIEVDMLEVSGGVKGSENSSKDSFFEIYSNSDFLSQFELINEDHKNFTNGKVLSLRCKAVKKFLPYEGFYPAQRTVDLAQRFYDSFKNNVSFFNSSDVQLTRFNYGTQMLMNPLFAPGVLFNTIKSGVAVDYPIITGSLLSLIGSNVVNTGTGDPYLDESFIANERFDTRIPFEALLEPHRYLAGFNLQSNEPHPSGNLSASAIWDGQGDELYSKMAHNFLAAVPEFFLPNGEFTSLTSKKQSDIKLKNGTTYGMRIKMRRSMDGAKSKVFNRSQSKYPYFAPQDVFTGSLARETFTMYSRPSAFGPPSLGASEFGGNYTSAYQVHNFGIPDRFLVAASDSGNDPVLLQDSLFGYNFPFTPPYYHGEAYCDVVFTATSEKMSIAEIQERANYSFTRFDASFVEVKGTNPFAVSTTEVGPQSSALIPAPDDSVNFYITNNIDRNAVQLSASLNIKGLAVTNKPERSRQGANFVVDSGVDEDARWVIQTKFETPMLNFNHISKANGNLSIPVYGSESVPRGMWHQYGRIPEENEGVFLEVGPIPQNYRRSLSYVSSSAYGTSFKVPPEIADLSEVLGFSGASTKIGRLRSSKTIYEAVVAVPFIEKDGDKKFFLVDKEKVKAYKAGGADKISLTTGDPQNQIGRSLLNQLQKMEKYVFPPSFDFINNSEDIVQPIAMYIFEFSHTFSQQDLSDIWQNLPPDVGTSMEESEVAITHPLLKKELLGQGGEKGNTLIDLPNKLKWMVFKVKQRAASNYFKKTVLRNPEVNTEAISSNVTVDEFGDTSGIQYNWPYDYFSLVELVKLDAEVEFGNFNQSDINNYTNAIPPYADQQADESKIQFIVGNLEDDILEDIPVPPEEIVAGASSAAGAVAAGISSSTGGTSVAVESDEEEEETQIFSFSTQTAAPVSTTSNLPALDPSADLMVPGSNKTYRELGIPSPSEMEQNAKNTARQTLKDILPTGKKLSDLNDNRKLRIARRTRRRTRRYYKTEFYTYPDLKDHINSFNIINMFPNVVGK